MPRATKEDKFFIYAPMKKGPHKGKRLMGTNITYEGGTDNITVQDLVDFLNEKGVSPSAVRLGYFIRQI